MTIYRTALIGADDPSLGFFQFENIGNHGIIAVMRTLFKLQGIIPRRGDGRNEIGF